MNGDIAAFNGQIYGTFASRGQFSPLAAGLPEEIAVASNPTQLGDGMFAYVRYNSQSARLHLGTDPHFIKPLFHKKTGDSVSFCSELSPLLSCEGPNDIDMIALSELFAYGWYLSDQTYAKNVFGAWRSDILIDPDGIRLERKRSVGEPSKEATAEALELAIHASVARCAQSGEPLGLALSGGLDSTILAHELNDLGVENLTCITIRTEDLEEPIFSLDQLGLPKLGSWKTWRHVVVETSDKDFLETFQRSALHFGQPTTMSSLALYQRLADAAAEAGVRCLILGEGVDEYHAGYSSYGKVGEKSILSYYQHPPREKLVELLFGREVAADVRRRFEMEYALTEDLRTIEVQLRLTRLLLRADVCLMARSIEGRVPFLHNGIPAMAMATPFQVAAGRPGKVALRQAFAPRLGILAQRDKVRFKAPDAMLRRCLQSPAMRARVIRFAGPTFGSGVIVECLERLNAAETFDADITCLLLTLTFLLEANLVKHA
ncbi:UNVERIFIED_ORG: hypothetical protein BTE55_09825 [Rhizobium sophorae]